MLASQPSEPQVSERVGPEARLRSWVVWALAGIVALATVVSLVNLIERGRRPESPKALASTTAVTKTIAPSLPQQARAEIIQMREADAQHGQLPAIPQQPQIQVQPGQQPQPAVDPVADIKRRREIALTLSPGGWVKGSEALPASRAKSEEDSVTELVRELAKVSAAGQSAVPSQDVVKPRNPDPPAQAMKTPAPYEYAKADPDSAEMPDGQKGYVLRKGRILEAVLENKLEGEFAGPVRCHVTTDVYADDGQHLLIPAGSVLLGEATNVGSQYQHRLAVLFTDLQAPGWSVDLAKAVGLDQEGATALRDKVNRHLPSTIAMIGAIGVLAGISQANSGNVYTAGGVERIYGGVGSAAAEMGLQILQQQMMRPPELTIRPGTRVRVWINRPLLLPEQQMGVGK